MNTTGQNICLVVQNPINQHHQINIQSTSINLPSQSIPLNLPRRDLIDRTEDFNEICVPLYNLLTTGRFEDAKVIIDKRKQLVHFSITKSCETPLHVAILLSESYAFVQYLMTVMTKKDLEVTNGNGETSLLLAARVGKVGIAKVLVEKNNGLIDIPDSHGRIPLQVAALFQRHDMVEYLYDNSPKLIGYLWTHQDWSWLLEKCVEAEIYGVALQIVTDHPKLAVNTNLLSVLAQNRDAFRRKNRLRVFARKPHAIHGCKLFEDSDALKLLRIIMIEVMKLSDVEINEVIRGPPDETKETQEALQPLTTVSENIAKMALRPTDENKTTSKDAKQKYSSRVLFLAAETGNTTFLEEVFRHYPYLTKEVDDKNQSVFHVAVLHGCKGIYRLLRKNGHLRDFIFNLEDKNGNNIGHLVGERASPKGLQTISRMDMVPYQEIRMFREIWRMLPSHLREKKNTDGLTPSQLFRKNHQDMLEIAMKERVNQSMVVAALVATISFAAVFTFPGGYNQDTGIPIFLKKHLSIAFIICDSLSFLLSTTSILRVLSIYMSPHHSYDIMSHKTGTIILSLNLVFYSIVTTIATFVISLFLLYHRHSCWIPILIAIFSPMLYVFVDLMNNGYLYLSRLA